MGCCKDMVDRGATAAKGLVTMTVAEIRRKVNPPAYVHAWMQMCEGCPSSQRHMGVLWCGTPSVDQSDHPDPSQRTCGCACRGKGRVAGEKCPQGKHVGLTVDGR